RDNRQGRGSGVGGRGEMLLALPRLLRDGRVTRIPCCVVSGAPALFDQVGQPLVWAHELPDLAAVPARHGVPPVSGAVWSAISLMTAMPRSATANAEMTKAILNASTFCPIA